MPAASGFMSLFTGKKHMMELLWVVRDREPVYIEQLVDAGWSRPTATYYLEELKDRDLVTYRFERRSGHYIKWVELTPKGRQVLEHLQAAKDIMEKDPVPGPQDR